MQVHIQCTEFYQSGFKSDDSWCDDAGDLEVTLKRIQYEVKKVSDMCRYAIKKSDKVLRVCGLEGLREVKDAVCFGEGKGLFQTILPKTF